ncbi:MAG: hypothetical protein AB2A00_17740 [Myxococcota bacterium]
MRAFRLAVMAVLLAAGVPAAAQQASPTTPPTDAARRPSPVLEGGNPGSYVSATSFDLLPTAGGVEQPVVFPGRPWTRPKTRALVEQVVLAALTPTLATGAAVAATVGGLLWLVPLRTEAADTLRDSAMLMTLAGVAPGLALMAVASAAVATFSAVTHAQEFVE